MDRSFELFMGRTGNAYSQEAARRRVNWMCAVPKGLPRGFWATGVCV